ncbi:hypothetical protein KR093_010004 [Drosophila rubida]|uniref:Uncharacterized protein n=1 Tax=Drosophila rubida TaxID=30044 RepID=A0AAD4PMC9_9MUSC|nr:hypothetical protein KR093_010004 [Drosophila rubida]
MRWLVAAAVCCNVVARGAAAIDSLCPTTMGASSVQFSSIGVAEFRNAQNSNGAAHLEHSQLTMEPPLDGQCCQRGKQQAVNCQLPLPIWSNCSRIYFCSRSRSRSCNWIC